MTNREKYNFDYFTIEHYRELVQLAKDQGFTFILHKDEFVHERKDVIWRHDVEFSPDIALKMAEIEHELCVQATYFFKFIASSIILSSDICLTSCVRFSLLGIT